MIKEGNPLEGYPLHAVFPVLRPCAPCCEKKEKVDQQEPLLADDEEVQASMKHHHQKKNDAGAVSEEEKNQDPYVILGFGMIAYRDLLFTMIIVFSILSVIMLPAMSFYNQHGGIAKALQKPLAGYSLGNMGYSSTQCSMIPLGAGPDEYSFDLPL